MMRTAFISITFLSSRNGKLHVPISEFLLMIGEFPSTLKA